MPQKLLLGTAQWGWTVSQKTAFSLLDAWLKQGQNLVDCATNYPINRQPQHFRAAEKILSTYVQTHGMHDLGITMKVGSLDNMSSPDVNLAPSFIQMMAAEYKRVFEQNLDCLMFHWDNREDEHDIAASLAALTQTAATLEIRPGVSGIKHPEIYRQVMGAGQIGFDIQLKHNVLQSDLNRYTPHFSPAQHHYFAYGINAGGIKLDAVPYPSDSTFLARGGNPAPLAAAIDQLRARLPEFNTQSNRRPIVSMPQIGLIYAGANPMIHGIVLGVSSETQLLENLSFIQEIKKGLYNDVYAALTTPPGLTA
jgi:aryl-alcohol dehydrogenase-like predicted oxidoreductase